MKDILMPIALSLLVASLAGCSLLPSAGDEPTQTPQPSIPPSSYEPQPSDDKLRRDPAFVELENSSLVIMESYPIQVNAILNGNLPDPCHQLRAVVTPANADNIINLEVYSVADPSQACITVIEPFTATIPLGSYSGAHYIVTVNGEVLGEFDS
jgi:hypothetical protein